MGAKKAADGTGSDHHDLLHELPHSLRSKDAYYSMQPRA
jgi:hypothetical protein